MRSDPTGQAALRMKEHTLPSSKMLLYCKLQASIRGESFEVKKVGDEIERHSISSAVICLIGPGSTTGLGKSVDMSSSEILQAQPVQAEAARSAIRELQAT